MEDPDPPPTGAPEPTPAPEGPAEAPPAPRVWDEGDPLRGSAPLAYVSERLCEMLDLRFGHSVLDVGTGTGNGALAAARRGARAIGLDPTPAALRLARARAVAEGIRARWVVGRSESLPFRDGAFQATMSTFGAMFADDAEMAAEEILRVTKEGGVVGLASWTSEGLLGRIYAAARPPQETDGWDPTVWGSREYLARWFGPSAGQMSTALRTVKLRGPSPEKFAAYLAKTLGPVVHGMAARDDAGRAELSERLAALCREANRSEDETFLGAAQYLEAVIWIR